MEIITEEINVANSLNHWSRFRSGGEGWKIVTKWMGNKWKLITGIIYLVKIITKWI